MTKAADTKQIFVNRAWSIQDASNKLRNDADTMEFDHHCRLVAVRMRNAANELEKAAEDCRNMARKEEE